jgi:serine/threonine-protein kinase
VTDEPTNLTAVSAERSAAAAERSAAAAERSAAGVPVLPDPPPEEFPRSFGNYLLLATLARGGMGEVFLAKLGSVAGLEKHCVVKTLRPHLTDDREYTSRFIDEARIVVQLSHRTICHVFDVGTVGERYYLAMEYIAGKDLRALAGDVGGDVAHQSAVINPGLALHIVSETLEALDYAHRQTDVESGALLHVVHRDVSPQNVMISWEGEVKLIDFGLAASTLKVEQTSPNVVMGKLAYMAPEQVRGERVDGRADLFATAVMLYELLAGDRFYEGRSPYEIWGIAAQGGFRPRGWSELSDDVRAILDRALAASASARYPTCLEMREALQSHLQARGLRGDAPLLRALMHTVYAQQIEESRRHLSILTKRKIAPRTATGSTSGPSAQPGAVRPKEPTVSLARSPSQSLENKRLLVAADEGTEPTERMEKQPFDALRRTPMAAATVGLVALAAVIALVVSRAQHEPPAQLAPARSHPVTRIEAAPAIARAPPSLPPAATTTDGDGDDVEPVAGEAKRPGTPRPVAKPKAPPDAKLDATVKAKVDAKVARASGTDVTLDVAWETLRDKRRVEELALRCAAQACTADIVVHRGDFGSLEPTALKEWKRAMRACWNTCGLP